MNEFRNQSPDGYTRIILEFQRAKYTFYSSTKRADDFVPYSHNCRLPDDFLGFLEDKMEEISSTEGNDDDDKDIEDFVKECKIKGIPKLIKLCFSINIQFLYDLYIQ